MSRVVFYNSYRTDLGCNGGGGGEVVVCCNCTLLRMVGRNGLNVGVGVIFLRSSVLKTPLPMQITEHTRGALVHTLYLSCVKLED